MSKTGTTEVTFIYFFAGAVLKILHTKPLDNEIATKIFFTEIMKSFFQSSHKNFIFKSAL